MSTTTLIELRSSVNPQKSEDLVQNHLFDQSYNQTKQNKIFARKPVQKLNNTLRFISSHVKAKQQPINYKAEQDQDQNFTNHSPFRKISFLQPSASKKLKKLSNNTSRKENQNAKQFQSNSNIFIEQINEKSLINSASVRNYASSFCINRKNKVVVRQCSNCLMNCKKMRNLEQVNLQISRKFFQKQSQIKKINQKMTSLNYSLKESEEIIKTLQSNLFSLKKKATFLQLKNQEIEDTYLKIQSNFYSINQQIKYKCLEANLSKIYKAKSFELQLQVQELKRQLTNSQMHIKKLTSKKTTNKHLQVKSHQKTNSQQSFQSHSVTPNQKQQEVKKVYFENSFFSLSSED